MSPDSLSEEAIRARLPRTVAEQIPRLWVMASVDSTNRFLRDRALEGEASGCVCLAETQTVGHGRRGRSWVSPPGGNLYLSLLWRFPTGTGGLGGLALSVAVATIGALENLKLDGVGIKWPNDLIWRNRKLGGILIEASGERDGECFAIIGIGLNRYLSEAQRTRIDRPVADLHDIGGEHIETNQLAAETLSCLFSRLAAFQNRGFHAAKKDYEDRDALNGREVEILDGEHVIKGVARGVNDKGALRVQTLNGIKTFHSGEVSVRVL